MSDPPSRLWISLLIVGVPATVLAGVGLFFVVASPRDLPLWENGSIRNGVMAIGGAMLVALAWSSLRAVSRIAERYLDRE